MLRFFTWLWIFISCALAAEYLLLNFAPQRSMLAFLQAHHVISSHFAISPEPGRQLSLILGWAGIGTMLLTNLYIIRKRAAFMRNWGRIPGWLDFHIFCGLVGPTLILFHCNFKVRGLVAISFWSMIISFTSGIVGRYLYLNLASLKQDSLETADHNWKRFLRYVDRFKVDSDPERLQQVQGQALAYAGIAGGDPGIFSALFGSISGDIRLFFGPPHTLKGLPEKTRYMLQEYAVNQRHAQFLEPFQRIMGYWHTFHSPFAVFMYVVAVIHIVAALLFGVNG